MEAMRLVVYGQVQGVFFRAYTQQKAQSLGLKGYVRNLVDGSVEIVAVGEDFSLDRLEHWCRKTGSPRSMVERVDRLAWTGDTEFTEFSFLR